MCGIAGFIAAPRRTPDAQQVLARMSAAIARRGPDSEGIWRDEQVGLGFAHRRLAIIDASAAGAQPMSRGALTVIFNGEIYNHLELREELSRAGHNINWQGHSDTETLLQSIQAWGVEGALRRVTGMFALALWDGERRVLTLARDRFGEKPMYYGYQSGVLLFGSDLAALRCHPAFDDQLNEQVLPDYLRYQYIPAPSSIYKGILKLPQASFVSFTSANLQAQTIPAPGRYWSLIECAVRGKAHPFRGTFDDARAHVTELLIKAVRGQMISDVGLGAFLSGGVDSGTVVALMQSVSSKPVHTFTIGSADSQFDESAIAKSIARHLGTDHTELIVTPEQALAVVPKLGSVYSEPFADSSQVPTALVSELARRHVTVALTGDAGDEVFGGYNRYVTGVRLWEKTQRLPGVSRRLSAAALGLLSEDCWDRLFEAVKPALPERLHFRRPGQGISKFRSAMTSATPDAYYGSLVSRWQNPELALCGNGSISQNFVPFAPELSSAQSGFSLLEKMMVTDMATYMSDDVLVKVDRAAMAHSLETRVPYLDHHLVEFMLSLPDEMKVHGGVGKRLLRAVLASYVPVDIYNQPKTGFGVPIGRWLRGPLRDWAESLLDARRLNQEGVFQTSVIRRLWDSHLSGTVDVEQALWPVLMFQTWREADRSIP